MFRKKLKSVFRLEMRFLVILVVAVVAFRAALPHVIRDYVNRTLDRIPEYDGQIGDVDVALWRGAYQIRDIDIVKTEGKVPVPFFSAPLVDLSVKWRALLDGALVGQVEFVEPRLNFVAGKSEATTQSGLGKDWVTQVQELFPLRIDRFDVKDGKVHFMDFGREPKVDIFVDDFYVTAFNLTNSQHISESLVARVNARGKTLGNGEFLANMQIDPFAETPTFNVDAQLTGVELPKLNEFFKAYGKIDVEKGSLDLFVEAAAKEGRFKGYVKPLFDDLQIFALGEGHKSILHAFWEAVVGAGSEVIENKPNQRLAAKVPLEGNADGPDANVFSTVSSILRNAFVRVLMPRLDREVELRDVSGG